MHRLGLLLCCTLLLLACRRDKGECPGERICTMDFRLIGVSVVDGNGDAVELDSAFVLRARDDFRRPAERLDWPASSGYVLLTDNDMALTTLTGEIFLFQGYLGESRVIAQPYLLRHDCCHVDKVGGPDTIVLE